MKDKNRLTINDSPEIGKLRYETYKGVLSKYKKAMEVGCYLEAITLMESIIFDRLASIVNEISEKDILFFICLMVIMCFLMKMLHTVNPGGWKNF